MCGDDVPLTAACRVRAAQTMSTPQQWVETVKECNYLPEPELKKLCEMVRAASAHRKASHAHTRKEKKAKRKSDKAKTKIIRELARSGAAGGGAAAAAQHRG